jgi:hypothetical protein
MTHNVEDYADLMIPCIYELMSLHALLFQPSRYGR